ncbi:MAG: hypothetical protein ACR2HD_00820 [Solirubrobacteraceae bacterium]
MTPTAATPPTVLVADEDEITRRFVCDNLLADGFEVLDAADTEGAIARLQCGPDVAVCDLNGATLRLVDEVRGARAGGHRPRYAAAAAVALRRGARPHPRV